GADCGGGGGARLRAAPPLSLDEKTRAGVIGACGGLAAGAVLTTAHEPVVGSVGLPFVLAEVTPAAIASCRSDVAATAEAARRFAFKTGRFSIHVYARTPGRPDGAGLRARMFSP